jgi:hypothetical protein
VGYSANHILTPKKIGYVASNEDMPSAMCCCIVYLHRLHLGEAGLASHKDFETVPALDGGLHNCFDIYNYE